MSDFKMRFDKSQVPKHKVELHVHLEGSVRIQTVWELAQKKNINLAESLDALTYACTIQNPTTLTDFLKPIGQYLPVFVGDGAAIERIAYEFCEDTANGGVVYVEVRYSPHLLSSTHGHAPGSEPGKFTPRHAIQAVIRGLEKGSRDFGIKVRSILCTIRGKKGWSGEVVRLCDEFRHEGVVAMDIAGDHLEGSGQFDTREDVEAFQLAKSLGIHRTAHAGENAPAAQVRFVRDHLGAERVGHGYRVLGDEAVYARCLREDVHFEACPHSSLLTGAVDPRGKHPVLRFIEDGANFSISRDDPTLTQKTLDDDYDFLRQLGVTDDHLVRANFNAARSCFLPPDEKRELIEELRKLYGVQD